MSGLNVLNLAIARIQHGLEMIIESLPTTRLKGCEGPV